MSRQMTLAAMASMEESFLTPDQVAGVIDCEPHNIRVQAATPEGREALGFRVIRIGRLTKIPRIPFLRFMGWEGKVNGAEA